jgi:hypothetical protein
MDARNIPFKTGCSTLSHAVGFLLALLSFLWVTPAAATDWTFDWATATPVWTGTMRGTHTYTNVASSGIDVRVTTSITNGSWLTGYPVLNGDPGQGNELNLRVNFNNRNATTGATVLIEFFQTNTTTPAPVALKGIAVRDVDRSASGNNCYQDVVTVTAVNQSGTTINPDFISQFTTTPNWTASGSNTISATGTTGIEPNIENGWASFNFATQTITSMTLQYKPGDGGGCTNPTQQWLWISKFVFSDTPIITQAVISSFEVHGDGMVEWETASEVGTAGFNLLRQDPASGSFSKINDSLLPTLIGSPQGGVYRYPDQDVAPGRTYTYRLEEVEADGTTRSYGPFTVTVDAGRRIANAAERAQPLAATETIADANGYARQAHAPSGRTVSPLAARSLAMAAPQASAPKTAARILVERDGLYIVSADQIATALGVTFQEAQTWINKGKVRLLQGGKPVAWRADPSGERLYFYGQAVQGVDSIYTRHNVYWLDNKNGQTMNVFTGTGPAPAAGARPFQSSIRVEENLKPAPFLATNPDADFWYWNYVLAGHATLGAPQFAVPTPGAAATGTVTLRAYLQGATDLAAGNDHHARVLVNGAEVGDVAWDGKAPHVLTTTFDASLLAADGNNTVTVRGDLDSGVSYSVFWVKGFELDYPRTYRATDGRLRLHGAGNPVVTVNGFSGSDIAVLDISDPRKPQWLAATTVTPADSDYAISFVPATPSTDYFAAVAAAPVSVEGATATTLKTRNSGAEYLVLAPRSLRAGADALAAYRGGKVVELQDIYDAFNDGIANPNAIREFLRYAYRQWQPRPRYVALVGKGTFDPKDYQRYNTNRFPVLMATTPHGLFASDNRYADISGNDGVPELAVGRIPALSNGDVQNYLAKLQAYEGGGSPATALLVADDGDTFTADSQEVERAFQTNQVITMPSIYFPTGGSADETRQRIISALNSGVGLLNYVGHGATNQLADEGLLRNEDVSQLSNGTKLPVFLAFTCAVGDGSYPGWDSLAETLLWRQDGGAIAALAAAGMSDNSQAHLLNLNVVNALSGPGARQTLGDAATAALTNFARQGGQRYMRDIYPVLGDPALPVRP